MSKTYRFDKYQRESKREPFVIELDDEGNEIRIPQPDGQTLMDAEECNTTRGLLSTVCGDYWDDVEPLVSQMDGEGLRAFAMDMAKHFGVAAEPEGKPKPRR